MNKLILTGLLATLVSCNIASKSYPKKKKVSQTEIQAQQSVDVVVDNRTLVKSLSINGIELAYNPVSLTHLTLPDNVVINTLGGIKVAEVRVEALEDSSIIDESGTHPVVSIVGEHEQLKIEIFDIDKSIDLLRHNFHDSLDSNISTLSNGIISIQKEHRNTALRDFVRVPPEAPVQNLIVNQVVTEVDQIGTSDFWFDDKLLMVKSIPRSSLSNASFRFIESIDLSTSRATDFKVTYSVEDLSEDFQKLQMQITNEISSGAFVTSNPVNALGYNCVGKINHELIRGVRIDNGIEYSIAFKKGYLDECMNNNKIPKKIFIYDENLKDLEVKFN